MFGLIYLTVHKETGHWYIGQRQGDRLGTYFGSGTLLRRWLRKYGKDAFCRAVLDDASDAFELDDKERYWLKTYLDTHGKDLCLNLCEGGGATRNPPAHQRLRISRAVRAIPTERRRQLGSSLRLKKARERRDALESPLPGDNGLLYAAYELGNGLPEKNLFAQIKPWSHPGLLYETLLPRPHTIGELQTSLGLSRQAILRIMRCLVRSDFKLHVDEEELVTLLMEAPPERFVQENTRPLLRLLRQGPVKISDCGLSDRSTRNAAIVLRSRGHELSLSDGILTLVRDVGDKPYGRKRPSDSLGRSVLRCLADEAMTSNELGLALSKSPLKMSQTIEGLRAHGHVIELNVEGRYEVIER